MIPLLALRAARLLAAYVLPSRPALAPRSRLLLGGRWLPARPVLLAAGRTTTRAHLRDLLAELRCLARRPELYAPRPCDLRPLPAVGTHHDVVSLARATLGHVATVGPASLVAALERLRRAGEAESRARIGAAARASGERLRARMRQDRVEEATGARVRGTYYERA